MHLCHNWDHLFWPLAFILPPAPTPPKRPPNLKSFELFYNNPKKKYALHPLQTLHFWKKDKKKCIFFQNIFASYCFLFLYLTYEINNENNPKESALRGLSL